MRHPNGFLPTHALQDMSRMVQISANGFQRNVVINEEPSNQHVRTIGGQPVLSITPPGQSGLVGLGLLRGSNSKLLLAHIHRATGIGFFFAHF